MLRRELGFELALSLQYCSGMIFGTDFQLFDTPLHHYLDQADRDVQFSQNHWDPLAVESSVLEVGHLKKNIKLSVIVC